MKKLKYINPLLQNVEKYARKIRSGDISKETKMLYDEHNKIYNEWYENKLVPWVDKLESALRDGFVGADTRAIKFLLNSLLKKINLFHCIEYDTNPVDLAKNFNTIINYSNH